MNCSKYIIDFQWWYLVISESIKSTDKSFYIIAINIKNTYIRNTYINSIYIMGIWIGCTSIRNIYIRDIYAQNTFVKGIKLKILIRLRIILVSQRINNYYL